ncbi:hypothetical protein GCM10011573_12150 [Enterococcus wangshanyuanii]|uniref:Uncharacterized protein n=1 Tax=Enterococcus wangshanyuanii TaxID=2005703 RepID=A0ABQ1NSD8_9ENTE|nr:hypothetical protein GCM10011573_12150 [Enterococcus wangshanyuanii]
MNLKKGDRLYFTINVFTFINSKNVADRKEGKTRSRDKTVISASNSK